MKWKGYLNYITGVERTHNLKLLLVLEVVKRGGPRTQCMKGGPYFDGPSPWAGSMEGVQGSGVHVLYFLDDGLVVWTVEPPVSDHTKHQAKVQVILLNVCVTQHNMGNALVNWNPNLVPRTFFKLGKRSWERGCWNPHPPDPGQIGGLDEGPDQIIFQNP